MKITGFLILTILTGCDRLCSSEVTEQVKIQNRAGRDLHLEVCKGKVYGTQQIDVPLAQDGVLTLGTRPEGYVPGGNSSCDRPNGTITLMGIALTSRNFSEVHFCYHDEKGADLLVIDTTDTCPSGTTEQTKPVDQCGT